MAGPTWRAMIDATGWSEDLGCSAYLVGPRLLVTAQHCWEAYDDNSPPTAWLGFEEVLAGENEAQIRATLGPLLSEADYEPTSCPASAEQVSDLEPGDHGLDADDEVVFLLETDGPDPGLELGTLLVSRTPVSSGDTTHLISRTSNYERYETGDVWYTVEGSNSFFSSSASEPGASGGPTVDWRGAVVGTNRMQCGLTWTDTGSAERFEFSVAGGIVPGPSASVERTWGTEVDTVDQSLLWDLSWTSLDAPAPPGVDAVTTAKADARLGASVVLVPGPTPGLGWLAAGAPGAGLVLLRRIGAYGPDPHQTRVLEGDEGFGASLAAADLDGDGAQELIVGQPATSGATSAVQVYAWDGDGWSPTRRFASDAEGFGQALAIGDFDGNTCADLAVSAPAEGEVHVLRFSGADCADPAEDVLPDNGGTSAGTFGAALAAADLDGDGHVELYIGAPGRASPALGSAEWTKGTWSLTWQEVPDAERCGAALAAFGPPTDQRLAIGAPGSNEVRIAAHVDGVWTFRDSLSAPDGAEEFGAALAAGPSGALAIGASGEDGNLDAAGAFVLSPEETLVQAPTTLLLRREADSSETRCETGIGDSASLGSALALGDPDGDGVIDLYIGAPGVDRCSRWFTEEEKGCDGDEACRATVEALNALAVQAPDAGAVLGLRDPLGLESVFGEPP